MPVGASCLMLVIAVLVANVLKHVLAGLVKLTVPAAQPVKDYSLQPTVSILLPCYNEGKTVYETVESISKSHYPNPKVEIIAIDDCSTDDSYQWLRKAQEDFTNIRISVSRNPQNQGKARTVCNALKQSEAEIVLSIDSDCIFHPEAIRELMACFADPKIGAVGGAVGVRNVNDNIATAIQTFVYYTNFRLIKVLENWTQSVICISGCMFAVRRELFLKLEPKVRGRRWLGIEVNDGEDRFLTHQILLAGYGTVLNSRAQCWTTVPNTLPELFKQQIRWQRSGVRDFLLTLQTLPQHVWSQHPNTIYNLVLPTLAAMSHVVVMLLLLFPCNYIPIWVAPVIFILYGAGAAIFDVLVRKHNPEQAVTSPLCLAAFAVWIVAGRLIEIIAMLTLDSRDWGTRSKAVAVEGTQQESAAPALELDVAAASGD